MTNSDADHELMILRDRVEALEALIEELRIKYNGHSHSTGPGWCNSTDFVDRVFTKD